MRIFSGRKFNIRYEAWGDPRHRPLLFFHGFPGSRIQGKALLPSLDQHQVYLIAADRPGYGETQGTGHAREYLEDLGSMLSALKVGRYGIVGVSGGAPWSHLMASMFPDHVQTLGIVCGLAPYNKETAGYFSHFQNRALKLRQVLPNAFSELLVKQVMKNFDPEKRLQFFLRFLDPSDQHILRLPAHRELIIKSMEEARKQSAKGIVSDSWLYKRDWLSQDCDLSRLRKIPAFYFHGKKDRILDHRMSEWMNKLNPESRLQFFDDEGHYSLPLRHSSLILSELLR